MYNDIADCDKAPCGKHCKVWVESQNPEVCPDDGNGCPMEDGTHLCGDSTVYICNVLGTIVKEDREPNQADEDVCNKCMLDQGPCGMGVRVCICKGTCPDLVPVIMVGHAIECLDCDYGELYNCYAGRC